MDYISKAEMKKRIEDNLRRLFDVEPKKASDDQYYKATSLMVRELLVEKRKNFSAYTHANGNKEVYYLSMEFLMGRSLKSSLYNLEIVDDVKEVLAEMGVKLHRLYEYEPDPGLGNGGLGRLAACYLDGLASQDYCATGHCILYEYGIFKQKIIDGWQTELPDYWLPGGEIWLEPNPDQAIDVHFGGEVEEFWDYGYHHLNHKNYYTVKAVPYDLPVSGYKAAGVSNLRLWKAASPGIDMDSFNRGDYLSALRQNSMTEVISKVLYPNDSHMEGKALRLRQQYFLSAASVGDIVNRHIATYGTLDNLADKIAIHVNDTHPTLAIPEMMRILLDECGYDWDVAWDMTQRIFAYTNHTVMAEALEVWNEDLFKQLLPRIFQIICEINRQFVQDLRDMGQSEETVAKLAIVFNRSVRMANLCVVGSHSVNGVSRLHSQIIKDDVFHEFYTIWPEKFTNVTNGIASRRWLMQSNPNLTKFITDRIGDEFLKDFSKLEKLLDFADDKKSLDELLAVKRANKEEFAKYVLKNYGIELDVDSIFDVQVKRLHEYKRQHLNALHILYLMKQLRENPNADIEPRTFIFGAKAAPGYYLAKQIIRLINALQKEIEADPVLRKKLRIVYLEDYRVTLSEILTPAADVSEQISLAGTEASGTGCMKFMQAGAITLGTYDGANVEIHEQVGGDENFMVFGLRTEEVNELKAKGYNPRAYYENDLVIRQLIDTLYEGIGGSRFPEIGDSLKNVDPYMVLADFRSYVEAQEKLQALYRHPEKWARMSLVNIATSGKFCADRAVEDYARDIWHLSK